MSLQTKYDVIIVGAGVVGLGTGWKLASLGYDVLLLDKDAVAHGASQAAGGMLAPYAEVHFHEDELLKLQCRSLEVYPDFVKELEAQTDMSVGYRDEGALVLALDRDDAEAVERVFRYQQALGFDVRWVGADEVHEMEPHLARVHSGVFCPQDHQLDNVHLCNALRKAFEQKGGTILEHTPVTAVLLEGVRVSGVELENGEQIKASRVLICAGAWSGHIQGIPELRKSTVRPVRGQMIAVDGGAPPLCHHVIRTPDAYLVPKNDGSLLIGATSEERGFDPNLTAGGVFELLRGAWRVLPGIYDQKIHDMWTGFRPVSLDDHPILGPSRVDGLWLATGHARHGILLAPITAILMSEMIHSRHFPEELATFSPRRFGS